MPHPLLEIGSVLAGRYEIETVLASGGFATVYVARHLGLRSPVALKVLKPDLSDNPKIRKRFLREARVVTALRHPGIVVHHDLGEEADGRMFLAMELLDGRSLSWVLRQGPVAPARAVHILRQLAAALDFSHEHGVLHRDLKPSNIMTLRYAGDPDHVKLIDFGILKFLETERRFDDGLTTNLTEPKAVIGTPEYMAPEQIRGQPLDARTDQYALGLVAWEVLTGERPFRAATRVEVLSAQLRDPPPPLTALACGLPVPSGLEDALRRVLAKAPATRFASCSALVEALASACEPLFGVELPASSASLAPSPPSLPSSLAMGSHDEGASEATTRPSQAPPSVDDCPVGAMTQQAVARRLPDAQTPALSVRVTALPPSRTARRRAPWLVGAAVFACAAALIAWLGVPRPPAPAPPGPVALRGDPLETPALAPRHLPRPPHDAVAAGARRLLEPVPAPMLAALQPEPTGELPAEVPAASPREPVAASVGPRASAERPSPMATLSIAVRPTGRVWVDGRRVGDGLVMDLPVKAGHRKVKVSNEALGITRTVPLEIAPGLHRKLLVDLETGRVDVH